MGDYQTDEFSNQCTILYVYTRIFPKLSAKRPIQQALDNEDKLLREFDDNLRTSVPGVSAQINVQRMRVWRTLKRHGLNQFHIQRMFKHS